jgi:hypothetical protein
MSTALREAAQQILVAWDNDDSGTMDHPLSAAIEALRDALAQEEQEPTARYKCIVVDNHHPKGVPLEQWVNVSRREWQGLTQKEIIDGREQLPTEDLCNWSFRQGAYFAETRLKEKNA